VAAAIPAGIRYRQLARAIGKQFVIRFFSGLTAAAINRVTVAAVKN
jgi:hypothetical protein